jgi:release factor glutamine methyltransferase
MKTSLFSDVTTQLTPISDTPALDASVLIAHIIKKPRTWVLAHPELAITAGQKKELDDSLARLEHGESFPYVVGHWEFFGLDFDVTPDVLIPRPETELLVEKAIAWLQKSPVRRTIADVGTGSGAIALSIAVNIPDVHVLATDLSHKALEVAQKNAIKFDVANQIDFVQCDLLPSRLKSQPTELHFDLICANLPYIPTATLYKLSIFGREPTLALDGGADGLDSIRRLLNIAPQWLAPNGMILLEIESTRGTQVLDLARSLFSEASIELHQDLAGQNRLLEIMI